MMEELNEILKSVTPLCILSGFTSATMVIVFVMGLINLIFN